MCFDNGHFNGGSGGTVSILEVGKDVQVHDCAEISRWRAEYVQCGGGGVEWTVDGRVGFAVLGGRGGGHPSAIL